MLLALSAAVGIQPEFPSEGRDVLRQNVVEAVGGELWEETEPRLAFTAHNPQPTEVNTEILSRSYLVPRNLNVIV